MRAWLVATFTWMVAGCAAAPHEPTAKAPATQVATAAPVTTAHASAAPPSGPRAAPDFARELEEARVTGTVAWFDTQDGVLSCSDLARCQEAVIPASTYKIAHSMIALETGVVDGPDTVLKWDKHQYWNEAWNQDLSLRDAFRFSCYPCYRDLARKLGEATERQWLEKLDYGNHDVSGGVDRFWLWGGLRISPLQQIEFLRRFDTGKLPISERTADIVRDIMTLDVTEAYVFRGKTGSTAPPQEPRELAWFVGWLERGERRVFVALLLDGHAEGVDINQLRRPLVERMLKNRGLM